MSRAYIRLDPRFYERKVIEQGYPPALAMALIGTFCLGESQLPRGRFRNATVLKALLGPLGRHVAELVARGDILVLPDGRLYPDGWDEWQEGDVTVHERVKRIRDRRKAQVTADVTPDVTVATVSRPSSGAERSGSEAARSGRATDSGLSNLTPDAMAALEQYTGRSWSLAGDRQLEEYDRLIGDHGLAKVVGALHTVAEGFQRNAVPPHARQLIWGAVRVLEPIPDGRVAKQAEAEHRERERSRRAVENTLRRNHELGGHADERHPGCPACRAAA